ncbi:hypothetical protein Tco_0576200 [Tanacetum coccineum]
MNRENTRRVVPVETTTSNGLVSCDGSGYDWSDQAEEGPTNFALKWLTSSTSSNFEVPTDSNYSSSCLENVKILKEQNEQLLKDLRTSKLNTIAYKTGLESVEARLLVYKKNKSVYEEDIKVLKHEIHLRETAITVAEKERIFMLKPDMSFSGLEEFTSEPIVIKPIVENSEAKASEAKTKVVRKNNVAPIIEDLGELGFDHLQGNPQMDLQDKGVIDSGCSRHMTGNMSYLTDYEEIDGGYVAFGGKPK